LSDISLKARNSDLIQNQRWFTQNGRGEIKLITWILSVGAMSINGNAFANISDLNAQSWAVNNIAEAPLYVDQVNANYNIGAGSSAIGGGTQIYGSGAADVHQQFIDRYSGDINYPGDPADYWPKDFLKQNRIVRGVIDIGPYEQQWVTIPSSIKQPHGDKAK